MKSQSLKPCIALIGVLLAFSFSIASLSTSVFSCRPTDGSSIVSCQWSMWKFQFHGRYDGGPGNETQITSTSTSTLPPDTTLTSTATSSETTTTTGSTTSLLTDTTTSTSTTTTTTMTETTKTTHTFPPPPPPPSMEEDNNNIKVGSSEVDFEYSVSISELDCKPLASHLQAMAAFSVLVALLCGIATIFSLMLFLGLEHCGTRCHNSTIVMVLCFFCMVLSTVSWAIGSNAYLATFPYDEVTPPLPDGNLTTATTTIIPTYSLTSTTTTTTLTTLSDTDTVTSSATAPTTTLPPPAPPSPIVVPTQHALTSCQPTSLKDSPWSLFYGPGWSLALVNTFWFAILGVFLFTFERAGSEGSELGSFASSAHNYQYQSLNTPNNYGR